jgi:DNA gyrase subunit B
METVDVVMTVIGAGGKFGGGGYKVSGGLHGVGVSAVNALSEWMTTEIKRDGKVWQQEYKRGAPQGSIKQIGKADKGETGTKQTLNSTSKSSPRISITASTRSCSASAKWPS